MVSPTLCVSHFLSSLAGAHCFATGQAGRLPDLDKLASQFFAATGAARDEIYKDATALAEKAGPVAKQYVRVMEKVVNGSEEYVEKESKRFVPLLFSSVRVGLIDLGAGWRASCKSARLRRRSWMSSRSSRTS